MYTRCIQELADLHLYSTQTAYRRLEALQLAQWYSKPVPVSNSIQKSEQNQLRLKRKTSYSNAEITKQQYILAEQAVHLQVKVEKSCTGA